MNNFQQFNLAPETIRALEQQSITIPSSIQEQSIGALINGHDVIAKAPTGTGKTFAFALPMLERIRPDGGPIQALVLAPTRELAIQIAKDIESLLRERPELEVSLVYGGQAYNKQIESFKTAQILVATPGRLLDHLQRKNLKLSNCHYAILDEADRMVDMGFIDEVKRILDKLPKERQIGLFSATLSRSVMDISWVYQNQPLEFEVVPEAEDRPQISAFHCIANGPQRVAALRDFCALHELDRGLIFVNMKQSAEIVSRRLQGLGLKAEHLHGGLNQKQRERILKLFRDGKLNFLVATDVAARGLDIDEVELVVNYDLPLENENYVHRIGRTGRAGESGYALTFYTANTEQRLKELLRRTQQSSSEWAWTKAKANLAWLPATEIDEDALKARFERSPKRSKKSSSRAGQRAPRSSGPMRGRKRGQAGRKSKPGKKD
ncbi:MAG: DEAD/DEAH box helicase [Eubacteriales bacterium]|nr:DEAD/DEAH box helicase [Eubacteriales bacterium]